MVPAVFHLASSFYQKDYCSQWTAAFLRLAFSSFQLETSCCIHVRGLHCSKMNTSCFTLGFRLFLNGPQWFSYLISAVYSSSCFTLGFQLFLNGSQLFHTWLLSNFNLPIYCSLLALYQSNVDRTSHPECDHNYNGFESSPTKCSNRRGGKTFVPIHQAEKNNITAL